MQLISDCVNTHFKYKAFSELIASPYTSGGMAALVCVGERVMDMANWVTNPVATHTQPDLCCLKRAKR